MIEPAKKDTDEALQLTWKTEVDEIAGKSFDQMRNLYEFQLKERQKKAYEPTDKGG